MATEVVNRQRLARIDVSRLARLADATLVSLGLPDGGASVVLVRDRAIRDLNRRYRGVDRATDVLSFPRGDAEPGGEDAAGAEARYAGDIAISTETALRQARTAGHSFEREVDELLIHGLLHLCGYDHATDGGKMNRLELRLRKQLLEK